MKTEKKMETHKLTEEAKKRIHQIVGFIEIKGEISFYNKHNILVGKSELCEFSTMEVRHIIAEDCGVTSYNDFILSIDNKIRIIASETRHVTLETGIDTNCSIGEYEGKMYDVFKNKSTCSCCGRSNYLI